jgi:hypothetical protein
MSEIIAIERNITYFAAIEASPNIRFACIRQSGKDKCTIFGAPEDGQRISNARPRQIGNENIIAERDIISYREKYFPYGALSANGTLALRMNKSLAKGTCIPVRIYLAWLRAA